MAEAVNPIHFGIIGCAQVARKVSRAIALAPNAAVAVVGSRSADKARRFVADNGLPPWVRAWGSYDAVLDDAGVDAVYMPLPTGLHLRWAVAAAERGKHLLLEKPATLCTADLDRILEACRANGVQFMDSTMWIHHPRAGKMREFLSDPARFGQLKTIHSIFTFRGDSDFLRNNIRVKPDLDALGVLGDVGWYCINYILWAAGYELPKTAISHREAVKNDAGVILSCGATLYWDDDEKAATFHCSFLENLTTEISIVGTKGTLQLSDFNIPFEEGSAQFSFGSGSDFNALATGWVSPPCKHVVATELPQEARMIEEFSRLARSIRDSGREPEDKWPTITRKTQLVLDAVKASIEKGFEPVEIIY